MRPRHRFAFYLIVLLLLVPVAIAAESANSTTYSFVHLSDTQNLATYYPSTYNLTFSQLESQKEQYNITAIIITGDLVNTWNKQKEWDAYIRARNQTSIPVYVIAGNHDTSSGKQYAYYSRYSGMPKGSYVTAVGDMDLVGIDYTKTTLAPSDLSRIRAVLLNSSRSYAIIATHYSMNTDGAPSLLGNDIQKNLIVKPTLILTGHLHADFIKERTINGTPVVEEMTNYQNGMPGGNNNKNYSAGMLYTVTSSGGHVENITARVIHVWPELSLDNEHIIYTSVRDPSGRGNEPASQVYSSELPLPSRTFAALYGLYNLTSPVALIKA